MQKCVSVGINTETASSTEENDSSESVTIVPAASEHEVLDQTPTDPEPNNILHDFIGSDLKQDEERNISRESHFHKLEELQVEVHIPNGNISKSELNLMNMNTIAVNGIDSSDNEDDHDSVKDNYDHHNKDNNHNYKQPLLEDRDTTNNSSSRNHRSNSCSCTMACVKSRNSRKSKSRLQEHRGESLLSMSESPDIFHLRAPLVSMENFVSSSVSSDSSLAEF